MNILVVRHNGIGDIIMTIPIINALYRKYNCNIDFMTMSSNQDLIHRINHINKLVPFESSHLMQLIYKYNLENEIKNSKVDGYDLVFNMNDIVEITDNYREPGVWNQTDYMSHYYDIEMAPEDYRFDINLDNLEYHNNEYIILALDSTSKGRTLVSRGDLIYRLCTLFPNQKFITLSRRETINANLPNQTHITAHEQKTLLKIAKNAKAIIATDNGTVHIGALFNVPVFAIYSCINPFQRTKYYSNVHHIKNRCPHKGPLGLHDGCAIANCMHYDYTNEIAEMVRSL